jgi:hypothetical protein
VIDRAEPSDLSENQIELIEAILGQQCVFPEPGQKGKRPAAKRECSEPHTRAWRARWVRTNLPNTVELMPSLARELIR